MATEEMEDTDNLTSYTKDAVPCSCVYNIDGLKLKSHLDNTSVLPSGCKKQILKRQ